jgi:hypothetical protein
VTHANKRFALAYLLLVIVPIAGLAGVLRSGRKLTAPTAIGGLWKMHVNADRLAAWPCGGSLLTMRDAGFTISQSGKSFTLGFARPLISSASGTIDGTRIKASLLISAKRGEQAECSGGRVLSLTAAVDSAANPNLMVGLLYANDCPICAPAEFRSIREEQTER